MIKSKRQIKKEIISKIKRIKETIKENKMIINFSKIPHQRDIARCKIGILKNKTKMLQQRVESI